MTLAVDISTWAWPQWTVVVTWLVGLVIIAAVHGQERTGTYNFPLSLMVNVISALVLMAGGFFA